MLRIPGRSPPSHDVCYWICCILRFKEVVHIKAKDIEVKDDFMSIQIPQNKTDQLCKGSEVVVSWIGSLSSVSVIEKYLAWADIVQSDTWFIFCSIARSVQGENWGRVASWLTQGSKSVSRLDWMNWDSHYNNMGYIVSVQVGPQWQPTMGFQTGYSWDMVDGSLRQQRMDM